MRGVYERSCIYTEGLRVYTICERFSDKLVGRKGNDQGLWLPVNSSGYETPRIERRQTRHLTTKRSFSFHRLCAHVHNLLKLVALLSSVLGRLRV